MMTTEQLMEQVERRTNLRQFGGYRTADGRRVKANLLFRSGELAEMNADEIELLANLDLLYICDLRSEAEQQAKPNPSIAGAANISIPAMGGAVNPQEMMSVLAQMGDAAKDGGLMKVAYKSFVTDPAAKASYRRLVHLVLEAEGRPVLWHCAAGKDRTGFAAAMLLLALGVPKEKMVDDYLRSNLNRIEANEQLLKHAAQNIQDENLLTAIKDMMIVQESYLAASLLEIENQFGSVDAYLEQVLGLTEALRDQLKSYYLED